MGLKDFERFLRKVSRLLYEDDITPIVIDYLIKYKFAEPYSMAVHLKLLDLQTGKADRILRTSLDRLKSHNLVVELQEKKEFFVQKHLPMLDSSLPSKDIYPPSSTANLSVYCLDENLMLILKARILMLYRFTNEKLEKIKDKSNQTYKCSDSKCPGSRDTISEIEYTSRREFGFNCKSCLRSKLEPKNQKEQLVVEEEAACSQIVKELYSEITEKFSNYLIPPAFFGCFQYVTYEGLGGSYTEVAVDDVDLVINVGEGSKQRTRQYVRNQAILKEANIQELTREIPQIVEFYKQKTLFNIKSKAISKPQTDEANVQKKKKKKVNQ